MDGYSTVTVADGRRVEVLDLGDRDAPALLFQHGTPGSVERFAPWVDAARAAGWRWVSFARAGNGDSDRRPGRSVADNTADVAAVLDAVGAGDFVTIGWSGGGPHALACAALLPDRCRGAITLGGLGPMVAMRAAGADPTAGMDIVNVGQFAAARAGEPALREFLVPFLAQMPHLDGTTVAGMLQGLVAGTVDEESLTGEFADDVAAGYQDATRRGADGWVDDFLSYERPWGFDLDAVVAPVGVWQGREDRMVPPGHGRFLVDHVPGAADHLLEGEGHLSVVLRRFDDVLAEAAAFWAARNPA